jgi:hypothetical protein
MKQTHVEYIRVWYTHVFGIKQFAVYVRLTDGD